MGEQISDIILNWKTNITLQKLLVMKNHKTGYNFEYWWDGGNVDKDWTWVYLSTPLTDGAIVNMILKAF